MFDISGKVALVTGATGAIGEAITRTLVAEGCTVAITGTRRGVLDDLVSELGEKVHAFPCDLTKRSEVDALIPAVEEALGPIDILVNNAGIARDGLAIRMSDEDWDTVLEVNLTAPFRLMRAAIRSMIRRRTGRIISIGSVVGVEGNAGQVNYSAAKAGLRGLTWSLAKEVAKRGITVNCIAPGYIETAMTATFDEKRYQAALDDVPVYRFGQPAEVASAVVYLASDEAAYMTGQTIHLTGGGHPS